MTTDAELVQQQIAAAQAANAAYLQAKQTNTPIPIASNPTIAPGSYVVPTMSSDPANTPKSQLMNEAIAYSEVYGGNPINIYNERIESVGVSQRFLDLQSQYAAQHFNIVGSSGILQYNQSGSYTYGAGYYSEMQGLPFQSNTLTAYQTQSLDSILNSPAPGVRDLLNVRGLSAMDPGILSGSIASQGYDWQTARNLAGFLTSREERAPYEKWYWGEGPATARTAMDAVFIGRGESAMFAPPPGSFTERFGFDSFGKVFRGGKFSPASSSEGIPFNAKMGNGQYLYSGEYRYSTGEVVSRFYEKNVGSFVDFSKFGVMSEPFVGIRGGGSPGAFGVTRDFATAIQNMPVDTGKTVFTQTKAAAYVQDVGGLPKPFVSTASSPADRSFYEGAGNWFKSAPILSAAYSLGASMPKDTVNQISGFVKNAPILESVWKGGGVFEMQSDKSPGYEKAASALVGNVDQRKLITYGAGGFLGNLGAGYTSFVSPLTSGLNASMGPVGQFGAGIVSTPASLAYIGQAGLVGGETLLRNAPSFPGVASAGFAMQIRDTKEQLTTNPAGFFGTLAGMALITGGVRAVGGRAGGIFRTRGMDYVPIENIGYDSGMGFPIGKSTEASLRKSFMGGTLEPSPTRMSLNRFEPGIKAEFPFIKLRTNEVPYIPGVGRPAARLPNAPSNTMTLWTGHEYSMFNRVKVGEAIRVSEAGSSEVKGIYGAPIAEAYFTKTGTGQMPKIFGIDMPFKSPAIYSSTVADIETVPKSVRMPAMSSAKNYGPMNDYIQNLNRQGGVAFMPLTKSEYEAVIPMNSVMEVTGQNYFTKLGGFGKSHFFGTRIPIIETEVIGFDAMGATPKILSTGGSSEYLGNKPIVSGFNLYTGFMGSNPAAFPGVASGYQYGGISGIPSITRAAYSPREISTLIRASVSLPPLSSPSYKISDMISATGSTKGSSPRYPSSIISPSISSKLPPYKSYTSSPATPPGSPTFSSRASSKITPPYTPPPYSPGFSKPYTPANTPPYSPTTTPRTTTTTPPYTPPYTPTNTVVTPPYTPRTPPPSPPPIFGFPGIGGGAMSSLFGRLGINRWKRRNPVATVEYLSIGLGGKKKGKKRSIFGGGPFG